MDGVGGSENTSFGFVVAMVQRVLNLGAGVGVLGVGEGLGFPEL